MIVDVASEGVRAPVSRERLRAVALAVLEAERVRDAMVSIALVSSPRMARLNHAHLGHSGATDVISFALGNDGKAGDRAPRRRAVVGDIYIAPSVARDNARRFGGSVREELERLVVHGTLHVLGYDHPEGEERTASAMWKRQERLLAANRPITRRSRVSRSARSGARRTSVGRGGA